MGRDHRCGSFLDPGILKGPDIRGIPYDIIHFLLKPSGILLDNEVGHVPLLELLRNGASHPAAPDDENRVRGKLTDVIKGVDFVIGGPDFPPNPPEPELLCD
jgi:hypothetical protein